MDVVVLSGTRQLLTVAACTIVPLDCANRHGHGNMSDTARFVEGSPMELVIVEGGCEMRAMLHGYVPPGVAAWTGCDHVRYRWDGERMVKRVESLSR